MSKNWMTVAACALACATWLSACKDAPAPVADQAAPAPAPASVAAPAPAQTTAAPKVDEPAVTAQAVESDPVLKQVVRVHEAKHGEQSLSSMQSMVGKYRWDGVDYLKQGVLAERLKALMGEQYDTMLKNLDTVGPLEAESGKLMVFGNRQRMGGEEAAAVLLDPERNGLRVWLLSAGQQTVFTDVAGAEIPWPDSVRTTIENQLGR